MTYGSVCSGIEAATVAWEPLGWKAAFYSEIEPFPCSVLQHHYPATPNYGDMTKFKEWPDATIDVLVGGTPCQSFSVAGLRKGLTDPRGNLMLIFGAIASRYRPKWLVWENVPGVLSSNGGRDFGTFLGMLGQLGYGFAYRVLDAQYVRVESHRRAVPQRRRRVFVVGYLGDWRRAAAVLFERESLSGNPAPRRKERQGASRGIEFGPSGGRFTDVNPTLDARAKDGPIRNQLAGAVCMATGQASAEIGIGIGTTLNCNHEAPIVTIQNALRGKSQNGLGISTDGVMYTLDQASQHGVAVSQYGSVAGSLTARHDSSPCADRGQNIVAFPAELSGTQCASTKNVSPSLSVTHTTAVSDGMAVRRLTPMECERLQGFHDNYTLVPHNKKTAADGPRYKALGNSMATNVMRHIGDRIELVTHIMEAM